MRIPLIDEPCHHTGATPRPVGKNQIRARCGNFLSIYLPLLLTVWCLPAAIAQDGSSFILPAAQTFQVSSESPDTSHSFRIIAIQSDSGGSEELLSLHLCQGSCVTSDGQLSSDSNLVTSSSTLDTDNGSWSFIDTCGSIDEFCSAEVTFTALSPGTGSVQLVAEYERVNFTTDNAEIFYTSALLQSTTEETEIVQTFDVSTGVSSSAEGSRVPISVTRSADPCCEGLDSLTLSLSIGSSSSATEGVDFAFVSGSQLSWDVGETGVRNALIDIFVDDENEIAETILVLLDTSSLPANAIVQNGQVAIEILADDAPQELTSAVLAGDEQNLVPGDEGDDLVLSVSEGALGQPAAGARVEWSVIPEGAALLNQTVTFTDEDGISSNFISEVLARGFIQVFATADVAPIIAASPPTAESAMAASSNNADRSSTATANSKIDPPAAPDLASNVVRFIVRSGFLTGTGLTKNQSSTGGALDNACAELDRLQAVDEDLTEAQIDLDATCDDLNDEVGEAGLAGAINRLMPEEAFAMADSSVEMSDIQVTNVYNRINALRGGAGGGVDLSGFSLNYQDQYIPGAVFNAVQRTLAASDVENSLPGGTPRLGVFVNGRLSVGETERTNQQKGADFSTQGITLGADYRLSTRLVLGGSIGYASSQTDFTSDSDSLDVEGIFLTLFGTWYHRDLAYVDLVLQSGDNSYDSVRRINLPGRPTLFANGSTDARLTSLTIGLGKQFQREQWEFGPYLRATATSADVDGYTETTASQSRGFGSVLSIGSHSIKSTTVSAGVQVSTSVSTSRVVLVPQLWVEGEFENESDKDDISARFVHDPTGTVFSIEGNERDASYVNYGLGTSIFWPGFRSLFVFYESQLAHDYTTQYWLKFGARFNF
ncbi:autotransporter outer membrane beta-barrel domain-containing protein [Granulosicoccus sp. 3-233]|uniref:autotransporter outer membrane beta-barrel domain-containing protein n=1 Tax=Granulosicoccus sp. 3-233 TaxID=3417969 RepID=UPI003D356750